MLDNSNKTNGLQIGSWINPTTLIVFVLLVVAIILFIFTRDPQNNSSDNNNYTTANVSTIADNDPRLIRSHTPVFGSDEAPVKIVEFSDFECPFCRESFPVVRALLNKYSDSIQFSYRNFPVESIHPYARSAAESAQCAHEQGVFLAFHDRVFLNQDNLTEEDLFKYAQQSGVDETLYLSCVSSRKYQAAVEQDLADGVALGVRATPTWFINGRKVEGAIPQDLFFEVVEAVIAEATGGK
jgi:protein-disulfide isomerase